MEAQRKLLAALMGTASAGIESFRDRRVCKAALAGLCPAQALAEARQERWLGAGGGACELAHDERFARENAS